MLKNQEFIKKYEFVEPKQITPKGVANNRLYSTLEDELKKPFNKELTLDNKVKVVMVDCVGMMGGGLLWEPQVWDLVTGESMLEPGFLPTDRAITKFIDEDGNESQISNYENMFLNGYSHFDFNYTEAIVILFNDGKEIHEFLFHENPCNAESKKKLVDEIRSLVDPNFVPKVEVVDNAITMEKHISFSEYLIQKETA